MPADPFGRETEPPAFSPPVAPESRVGAPAPADREPAPEPGTPQPTEGAWPWWTAFAALAAGWLIGQVLAGIVISIGDPGALGDEDDAAIGWQVVAQLVFSVCLVGSALFFARLGGRVTPERFGLRATHVGRALLWVVAGFFTFTLIGGAWLQLTGADDEQDLITETLTDDPTAATVAGFAFLTVVVAPIVEEVVFRGFVFNALRSRFSVAAAAVLSGLLFGVVHIFGSPVEFLVPLALLGTILALILWKTRSLYPCIALHALNNCIAFGAARDWSWEILPLLAGSAAAISAVLVVAVRLGGRRPQPV